MSLTYPAALLFQNTVETATITVPGALPLTPPSFLQDHHVGRKCRIESDTMAITVALAVANTIDTFGLFGVLARNAAGLDITSGAVTQIRASLTDASAVDGAVYDSGLSGGRVSAYYGNLVGLRDGSASLKYIRYDLSVAGAAYIEAGFSMIGLRNQAAINFQSDSDTPVDPSIVTTSRSGADWIDERTPYREWDFNFGFLNSAERFGWVEDLDRLIGIRKNIMVVRDCSSANLGRDTLCGRITVGAPVVSRTDTVDMYSKSYKIKQRQ